MLRNAGYKTGYKEKWHLQNQRYPEMEKFGFGDWEETTQHGGVYQEPEQSSTNPLLIKQSPG